MGAALPLGVVVAALLAGCAGAPAGGAGGAGSSSASAPAPAGPAADASGTPETTSEATAADRDASAERPVVGTVLRFTGGGQVVDVTLDEDNPTSRDLVGRLPTTLRFEEFAGREKIAYPAPGLAIEGSPGSDPEDGDLIYFSPWGNLGFYYDAAGIGFAAETIHLGRFDATPAQLAAFDDADVTIEVVG
ncbi:cyclophilin-like fold protein [Clavibacter michiganensis]|uniref:cyclophilin-like fold protein n=1 Tax=Clavibacter michiganensis TaxID=28447 RepID=UPI0011B0189C|nr:cyclophilin-like fold protein [Clavibacter michiganensis]